MNQREALTMHKQPLMRKLAWAATLGAMLVLSSCTAPGDSAAAPDDPPAAPALPTSAPGNVPAPPAKAPAPPAQPLAVDPGRACRVDSDCAMKDAGSCCGYRPVCVNKDTATFPEKVKAACAKEGRVGICGFAPIEGCQCVAGKCKGLLMMENSVPLQ